MKHPATIKTLTWVFELAGRKKKFIYAHVQKIGKRYHAKIVGRETPPIVGFTEQSIEQQLRQIIETPTVK